jgi:predicted ATPase
MSTRIVITGGPGAGKTALIELLRKTTAKTIGFVPESASILFGGGFPRSREPLFAAAAQRAIVHVQRELEAIATSEVVLCDRGSLDGLAYWPYSESEFYAQLGTRRETELARYYAVVHLRTPLETNGYGHQNPLRVETAAEAAAIDARIVTAWEGHPRRFFVDQTSDFVEKTTAAMRVITELLTTAPAARSV